MNWVRGRIIKSIFIFFTGIVFLNMSFFMAELNALELDENNPLVEKLLTNSITEEESDCSESSSESNHNLKELALSHDQLQIRGLTEGFLKKSIKKNNTELNVLLGHKKIFSPPPEFTT